MGHPDFRLQGRIFASLMADGVRATVKLAPEEQAAFVEEAPRTFAPAAGAWGRQGWTTIQLPARERVGGAWRLRPRLAGGRGRPATQGPAPYVKRQALTGLRHRPSAFGV